MIENEKKSNFLIAKEKADQVDSEIIQTLQDCLFYNTFVCMEFN